MKKTARNLFVPTLLFALCLALAACSGKHENSIVGKWKTSQGGGDVTVSFSKDGKMVTVAGGHSETGEFTLSASNTISINDDGDHIEFAIAFANPDEMTLIPKMANGTSVPGGVSSMKFTRVPQ